MFRRHHLLTSLGLVLVTAALSSGCSDEEQATPRVTFDSNITPGKNPSKDCPETGTWFTIGSFGNPALGRENPEDKESPLKDPVRPVEDGAGDQQGTVSISCSVTEAGEGRFEVAANAVLNGATGGAVTISGVFTATGDQQNITVAMTKQGRTYRATNCTAKYDTQLGHAVAAGRVWAQVECPAAEERTAQRVCQTQAQFRFENCSQ